MANFNSKNIMLVGLKGDKGEQGERGERGESGTTVTESGVELETWNADTKLDKVSTTTDNAEAYVKEANGTQGTRGISRSGSTATGFTLVERTAMGGVSVPTTPYSANDATSKFYVDKIKAENQKQAFQIADLKNIVYGTVIDDAEHTFEDLDAAALPTHISDGTDYHKVFDGSELMLSEIIGNTVAKDGELYSVELDGVKVNGLNLFDKTKAKNNLYVSGSGVETAGSEFACSDFIRVVPNSNIFSNASTSSRIFDCIFFDIDKTFVSKEIVNGGKVLNVPSNAFYVRFNILKDKMSVDELMVCYSDTIVTKYTPYKEPWEFSFDETQTLKGAETAGDKISIVPKANGLFDVVKTVYMASVDLGTLDYSYQTTSGINIFSTISLKNIIAKHSADFSVSNWTICNKYVSIGGAAITSSMDKTLSTRPWVTDGNILIVDSDYSDAVAFKAAMSGVMLYYEKATPTTETIMSDLTEQQVATLTELNGSIETVCGDVARPNVKVIMQVEKAVEQ